MSLSRFFWWIYQLPIADLIRILLVCTIVFLWLHRQFDERPWWRAGLLALLTVWVAAFLWVTILNRSGGTVGNLFLSPFHSYREFLDTGNGEILRSSFMNVALFYPAGLLWAAVMPKGWSITRRTVVAAAVFCLFSLSIELVQYRYLLGRAEIDDVIHNTLGAGFGCLALFLESFFPSKIKRLEITIDEKNHAGFRHSSGGH